jgi:hypothetical protein
MAVRRPAVVGCSILGAQRFSLKLQIPLVAEPQILIPVRISYDWQLHLLGVFGLIAGVLARLMTPGRGPRGLVSRPSLWTCWGRCWAASLGKCFLAVPGENSNPWA